MAQMGHCSEPQFADPQNTKTRLHPWRVWQFGEGRVGGEDLLSFGASAAHLLRGWGQGLSEDWGRGVFGFF